MNMKRTLTAILASALAVSAMSISAFATGTTQTFDQNTDLPANSNAVKVSYSVAPAYTVVIPADIVLSDTDEVYNEVKIYGKTEDEKVFIPADKEIQVTISASAHGFKVVNAGDELSYTVSNTAGELTIDEVVASARANTKTKERLTYSAVSGAIYAGEYSDNLTFTVALVTDN